jgi:ABC-type polysaccharide/polyol phosphate export permease
VIAHKILAVTKKDFITALRYRNAFLIAGVSQAAQIAAFYFLSRAVGPQFHPDGMPYFLFLLIGTGFYSFLMGGAHSFLRHVQESQQSGTLEALLSTATPAATLVSLGGFSAFAGQVLQFTAFLGVGVTVFSSILHVNLFACGLALVTSVLIAFAIGLFAAGVQISLHKGSSVLWLVGSFAWLLSGTLFPVASLPRPAQLAAALVPFTHSLMAMRLAILSGSHKMLVHELAILSTLALALTPAALCFFSWTVTRARQNGTLAYH